MKLPNMKLPRILITACKSGSGKTLISCGILWSLKNRGMKVTAFKCGPDYIDPMFHREVLGIDSRNLDTFLCGRKNIPGLIARHAKGSDISVIEGVMGYYDGLGGISSTASAYDVAEVSAAPAVLIVDCAGASVSVVPCIQGFLHYQERSGETEEEGKAKAPDSHIRGVILNRLSPALYGRMKQMIEEQTSVKVYGYVPVLKEITLESRHLGLKTPGEIEDFHRQMEILGNTLDQTLDFDGLIELANSASELPAPEQGSQGNSSEESRGNSPEGPRESLRIGVARDEAFCFLYQDNIDILRKLGAQPVYFSPLHDAHLPGRLDGLLLYGGYPELYAKGLSDNRAMRAEVKALVENGTPCIAECGGFMYLQEMLQGEDGQWYEMAGALRGKSYRTQSLRRFGYITLQGGAVFGQEAGAIPAHEFHYYDSEECGHAFTAQKPLSERSWECMISTDTLLAGYPHIHYGGNRNVAKAFLDACRRGKDR